MALRTLSMLPGFIDSGFTDRFNRLDRLFSQLTGEGSTMSVPSYDIRRYDDAHYALTVSVPGWKESELEIETVGGQLTITGKREEEEGSAENDTWLHRGIIRSNFQLSYDLPKHIKVTGAKLENGLLAVDLYQEIPESEKPKKIAIEHSSNANKVIEHDSKVLEPQA